LSTSSRPASSSSSQEEVLGSHEKFSAGTCPSLQFTRIEIVITMLGDFYFNDTMSIPPTLVHDSLVEIVLCQVIVFISHINRFGRVKGLSFDNGSSKLCRSKVNKVHAIEVAVDEHLWSCCCLISVNNKVANCSIMLHT